MTHCGRHAADLPVSPFAKSEFDPEILNGFTDANRGIARRKGGLRIEQASFRREGFAAFNDHAGAQRPQSFFIRQTLNQDEIGFGNMVLGIEEEFVQMPLIGKQQQALRVGIQPPDRVDIFWEIEISERPVGTAIRGELRQNAVGFMECENQRTFKRVKS